MVNLLVFGLYLAVCSFQINAAFEFFRSKRQAQCHPSDYLCKNGQCISSYDKCDGVGQCADGSDETFAACKAPGIECPLMSFECEYGACVDERLRCDGKTDCADASDERGCLQAAETVSATTFCSKYEFQCTDGQCISGYDICDGVKHCQDGSDESRDVCWDYECPSRSFKCSYGACLDPSLRCNGRPDCTDGSDERGCPRPITTPPSTLPTTRPTRPPPPTTRPTTPPAPPLPVAAVADASNCRLPPYPKNGAYSSHQCAANDPRPACRNTPGAFVPSTWVLKYTCNTGYSLNKDSVYSVCENGVWQNTLDCIKLCPPLKSLSVHVRCYYGGAEIDCLSPMRPDTQATAQCKPHYQQASLPEYSTLACLQNGEWSYRLFYCTPDCGLSSTARDLNKASVPLISNGAPAKVGEFPWLAAIYRKTASGTKWDQQCGGTLITTHIVVTAAHCLVNNDLENIPLHPTEIKVGLGKYQRDFYVKEPSSLIADVREVLVPPQYAGHGSLYAQDIGLLDLVVSVQVTAAIMPACVDWFTAFEPAPDAEGLVAGWGKTEEGGPGSEVTLSARLKFIKYNDCLKMLSAANKRLLTHDKFCAGNVDGSQVNKGDSGGGLTFLKEGKHFLIGVMCRSILMYKVTLRTEQLVQFETQSEYPYTKLCHKIELEEELAWLQD